MYGLKVFQSILNLIILFKEKLTLIFLGVTQATQGAGFSGLRFAPVPMKIGTEPFQSLTQTQSEIKL